MHGELRDISEECELSLPLWPHGSSLSKGLAERTIV